MEAGLFCFAMRDERTFCPRCRGDYLEAGYRLRLIPGHYKEPCDKCGRSGLTFELIEESKMLKACKYCGRVHDRNFDCGRRPVRTRYNRSEAEKIRYTAEMNAKSREIKERQMYLCPVCVSRGDLRPKRLETHHIEKLRLRPDLLLADENLIALCEEHHEEADQGEIDADYLRSLTRKRDGRDPPGGCGPRFL